MRQLAYALPSFTRIRFGQNLCRLAGMEAAALPPKVGVAEGLSKMRS